jgi:hypothetical protein
MRPKVRPRTTVEIAAVEALNRLRERAGEDSAADIDLALKAFPEEPTAEELRVESGQVFLEEEDGTRRDVTDGAELVELFGADPDVRRQVVWAIWFENNATDELKNALRSSPVSGGSSDERDQAAAGLIPAAPAANAKTEASAVNEPATASIADA